MTAGQEVTFTCVPPGSGSRIGIDRDGDGAGDGDEGDAGTDSANPADVPSAPQVCTSTTSVAFKRATLTDRRGVLFMNVEIDLDQYAQETVSVIATDGDGPIMAEGVAGASIVTKGSASKYRAPKGATGIKTITIREKRNSGGIFKITLRTIAAWAPGAANQLPSATDIRLNFAGRCFIGDATKVN
jgi:hypothetical protein